MQKRLYALLLFLPLFFPLHAQLQYDKDKIMPSLWREMQAKPYSYHKIRLVLKDRVDVAKMDEEFYARKASLQERSYQLITALQNKARLTQPAVLEALAQGTGVVKQNTEALWITNMILADMLPERVYELSLRSDIDWIEWDSEAELDKYVKETDGTDECVEMLTPNGVEAGLKAIKAPALWKKGYTGNGRVVMTIDTGVDYTHPAIYNQWRGNYVPAGQAWKSTASTFPVDCDEHGTHTVGTMVGLNPLTNDTIGVAFGATWIGGPGISCPGSNRITLFQWALDPDGNPNTTADMPDAINNSWFDSNTANECSANNSYRLVIDACEAVGIAVVFSAGNEGPNPNTITKPKNINANLVNVFCVANVNGNTASYPINSSSSRGPSACGGTGSLLIKPEVAAPGTNVRSCVPGGGYAGFTGTSMAAPHAAGAIALLKEAFPNLTGMQLKLALYYTCTDLGAAGEDNDYGMGLINLEAAFDYLVNQGNTPVSPTQAFNVSAVDLQNVPATTCESNLSPTFVFKNNGANPLTSVNIVYKLSNGFADSLNWTGNLAAGASTSANLTLPTLQPGIYNLQITAKLPANQPDGALVDNTVFTEFKVYIATAVSVIGDTICSGSTATLSANANPASTIAWYASNTSAVLLDSAASYTTPVLTSNKTYFVDAFRYNKVGKIDDSGNGGYLTALTSYLIFDAFQTFTLQSVKVYANTAGNRTIQIRNSSGTVIGSKVVNIPQGEQTITLNLQIPAGEDLRLGIAGMCDLFRNTTGVSFPYTVPGLVSIKNGSSSNQYFFFYDWKIAYPNACGRVPVTVVVQPAPALSIQASTLNLDISGGPAPVDFTAVGGTSASYSWNFGDGNTSSQQNPSHVYNTVGQYTVSCTTTDEKGCSSTQTLTLNVNLGSDMELPAAIGSIQLSPNPTQGDLFLHIHLAQTEQIAFSLLNAEGKEVLAIPTAVYQHEQLRLDLSGIAAGNYLLRIEMPEKGQWWKKVVRQ